MFKLNNSIYELECYFNSIALSDLHGASLQKAIVYEELGDPIPSCFLDITVPLFWLDSHIISDGALFKIQIFSKQRNLNEFYEFRLLNIRRLEQQRQFIHVEIEAILDVYDIYSHPNEVNMYGRSSEVFKKVAVLLGIQSEIDNTNDEQLWCANGRSIYDFCNYITSYGWANDASAMIWTIDRHKILLYKDIANMFYTKSNKIYKFVQSAKTEEGCYCYNNAECEILSGKNNFQNNGYGASDTLNFDLLSYDYKRSEAKTVRASSKFININPDLIKGLNMDWCVFDVGNFHKNYYKAYLQNKRILSTYSTYITLKSDYLEQYRLGQIVNLDYSAAREKTMKINSLSGCYMINSITISFTNSSVSCDIGLMLQGLNT